MRRPSGQTLRYKILVADDEESIRYLLRTLFKEAGHTVFCAASGQEALLIAVDSQPDIALCDVRMPGMDGFEFCRRLRADPRTARIPVLLASGTSQEERDQLQGFAQGADDYVLKPFVPALLLAKVEAVVRRHSAVADIRDVLRSAGTTIDVSAQTVTQAGRRVCLTRKEFDLLTLLIRKRGRVLTPQFLLEAVWEADLAERNDHHTVAVHISSLRRKSGQSLGRRIVTVPGRGYRFEE
jgi:two-component system alkaline phosphatase synthesis response regulator PhoP